MVSICCPIKFVSSSVVIFWAALFARMIRRDRSIKNKASEKISAAFFNIAAVAVGSGFRLLLWLDIRFCLTQEPIFFGGGRRERVISKGRHEYLRATSREVLGCGRLEDFA